MAYEEYSGQERSYGKCLYQLRAIGIPLHIVESVIFSDKGKLQLNGILFATYDWNEENVPVFTFTAQHDGYNQLAQPPIFHIMASYDLGANFEKVHSFSFKNTYEYVLPAPDRVYMCDKQGRVVNSDTFIPKMREESSIEDKAKKLQSKFRKK